jgi:hypothetical protein
MIGQCEVCGKHTANLYRLKPDKTLRCLSCHTEFLDYLGMLQELREGGKSTRSKPNLLAIHPDISDNLS